MCEMETNEKLSLYNILKALVFVLCFFLVYNHYNLIPAVVVRLKDPKFSLLGPYNTTAFPLDDVYNQLIDIKNFTFKINPQACLGYQNGLLLLIIVSSKPDNFKKRNMIRNTWGRTTDSMKLVFLLGETNNSTITKEVLEESVNHEDIVLGSFTDAYRNMTYKHVMGLKWVVHHCPTAKYILKTDDDVFVNSHELRKFLVRELSPWGANGMIMCYSFNHSQVQRSPKSKWYVPETEFAAKFYPKYCAGMIILYSRDVVSRLLSTAQTIPYFWIDDVHITGVIAEKNGIERTSLTNLVLSGKRLNLLLSDGPERVGQFLFGPQDLTTDKILEIWKSIPV